MKKNVLLGAGFALVFAASSLLFDSPGATGAQANAPHKPTKTSVRLVVRTGQAQTRIERPADSDEAANLSAWQSRFQALLAEGSDRDDAIRQLLQEIDAVYHAWVSDQLLPVIERPAGERYDELADIGHSVDEGAAAILDQLGIEESQRAGAFDHAADALSAEFQYAEAARDSESRLALLRLDRERQTRLEQALALTDETARTQAVAQLDVWYESGLGGIFAEPDSGSDDGP